MTLMLCVDEPYASAIFMRGPNGAPLKQWETRPSPPNGEMRPDGVRGLPGASLARGERIIIASTRKRPQHKHHAGEELPPWCDRHEFDHLVEWTENVTEGDHSGKYRWAGPVGVILGSVSVINAVPITPGHLTPVEECIASYIDGTIHWWAPWRDGPPRRDNRDMSSQLSWGDWTSGRWAWRLIDPLHVTELCPVCMGRAEVEVDGVPCRVCDWRGACDPIPVRGHQGLQPLRAEALR